MTFSLPSLKFVKFKHLNQCLPLKAAASCATLASFSRLSVAACKTTSPAFYIPLHSEEQVCVVGSHKKLNLASVAAIPTIRSLAGTVL